MFNISGQNVNFVRGLVDQSLDVQINWPTSINIVINMLFYTNCTRGHWRRLGSRFGETKSAH